MDGKVLTRLSLSAMALWAVTAQVQAQTSTNGEVQSGVPVQQPALGQIPSQHGVKDTTRWLQLYTADGEPAAVVMSPAPEHKHPQRLGLHRQLQSPVPAEEKKFRSGLPQLVWGPEVF